MSFIRILCFFMFNFGVVYINLQIIFVQLASFSEKYNVADSIFALLIIFSKTAIHFNL